MTEKAKDSFDPKQFVGSLRHRPGVYRMLNARAKIIYVGKARDLKKRVASYFQKTPTDVKTASMVDQVAGIEVTVTNTEAEALILEYNLIKRHRPRFNVVLRDDKSYPYIYASTTHAYPRLRFHRGARKGKGRYLGPTRALTRYVRRSTSCKSCSCCATVETATSKIGPDPACSIRLNVVRRRALISFHRKITGKT